MAYKFQVGPARLSGSLVQEGNVVAEGDASASNLSASTDVLAGGNVVAAGEIRGTLQRTLTAGAGLSGDFNNSADVTMAVQVDDASLEIDSDALRVKALGVTNGMLAGDIENAKLVNDSVEIGLQGSPSFLSLSGLDSVALGGTGSIVFADGDFRDDVRSRLSAADFVTYSTGSGEISVNATGFTGSARSVISVTDAGGDGSMAYDAGTGVLTYTGPSAAEVRAHLSADDILTYDNSTGVISVDASNFSGSAHASFGAQDILTYDGAGVFSVDGNSFTGSARSVLSAADFLTYDAGSGLIDVAGGAFTGSARSVISVTDAGGDGSLAYDSASGVLTYTGPSAAEVRAHLSADDIVTYDNATGVISVDASAFTGSARSALSAADFVTYDAASGEISVAASAFTASARAVINPLDTDSIDASYDPSSGEFSGALRLSGSTSFEIDTEGLKLKSTVAGNGLSLSAAGELAVNPAALVLDVQSATAAAIIADTTDVQLVNIAAGGTMTMPSPTSGKLLRIKRTGGGDVTLSGTFSDGSPILLEEDGAAVSCVGDGSNWHIM